MSGKLYGLMGQPFTGEYPHVLYISTNRYGSIEQILVVRIPTLQTEQSLPGWHGEKIPAMWQPWVGGADAMDDLLMDEGL